MPDFSFDIFISYSSEDITIARNFAIWLRKCNFKVWLAEEQLIPGSRFRAGLQQGIRESKHLLALLTESYLTRPWTQREIDLFDLTADHSDRRILAIQLSKITESPIDQVFLVNQRIDWSSKDFDPSGFWQLYCGLSNKRPGPNAEWTQNGKELLAVCESKKSKAEDITKEPKKRFQIKHYSIPSETNNLVNDCLYNKTQRWKTSFIELNEVMKKPENYNLLEKMITRPWRIGRAEYASISSLAYLPDGN